MYERDQRNRRSRRQGSHSSGEFDQYGSRQQPQQWSGQSDGQPGEQWDYDEFSQSSGRSAEGGYAPGPSAYPGDYRDNYSTGENRGYYSPPETDHAPRGRRTSRGRINAYGPSGVGFNQGYAQAADGSGPNPGFSPGGVRGSADAGYGMARHRNPQRIGHYDREEDRGFFDRATDEVASWFGDEEAARRREEDHRGRGPEGYVRSDERIRDDACDRLTEDWAVDARNITLSVSNGEITLDGTVDSRRAKRRAEDCVENISGVGHVQNNLRVQNAPSTRGSTITE